MSKYGYYIRLEEEKKPKPTHKCRTPGWWDMLLFGAKRGAIWHCMECGQEWIYQLDVFELGTSGECTTAVDWVKTKVKSP